MDPTCQRQIPLKAAWPSRAGSLRGHNDLRYQGRATLSPDDALTTYLENQYQTSDQSATTTSTRLLRLGPVHEMHECQYQPLYQLQASLNATKSQPSLPLSIESATSSQSAPTLLTRIFSSPLLGTLSRQPSLRGKHGQVDYSNARSFNWGKIPLSAFERILFYLRNSHLNQQSTSCSTCYIRDLISFQSTSKFFRHAVQRFIYTEISITDRDPVSMLKRLKISQGYGARLILLRRTLRANSTLAALVQTLQVPDPIIPIYLHNTDHDPNPAYDHYVSLLASLVMECPNLRLFTGFIPFYNHTFDRLTHALSTRRYLTSHTWLVTENTDISQRAETQLAPGHMDRNQVYEFQIAHANWSNLDTLLLCSPASAGILEADVLIEVLHSLPELRNLSIAGFDADDFSDSTLLALPRLHSLRLEELVGISDAGLSKWSSSPNAMTIEKLTLVHLGIGNLLTIAKMLARLERLKRFSIAQTDIEPILPSDMEESGIIMQPIFASRTLEWLHWDIVSYLLPVSASSFSASASTSSLLSSGSTNLSTESSFQEDFDTSSEGEATDKLSINSHLALSILHNGFPQLINLRAPRDVNPPGTLQAVCRPISGGSALFDGDLMMLHTINDQSDNAAQTGNENRKIYSNDLQMARIRAQRIIDAAKVEKKDFFKILVTDHSPSDVHELSTQEPESATSSMSVISVLSPTDTISTDATEPDSLYSREPAELEGHMIHAVEQYSSQNTPKIENVPGNAPDWEKEVVQSDSLTGGRSVRSADGRQNNYNNMTKSSIPPYSSNCLSSSFSDRTLGPKHSTSVQKVREYALPSFIGRISFTKTPQGKISRPPIFHLKPDIPGNDVNGGLVGWGEYLRVAEREKAATTTPTDLRRKPKNEHAEEDSDEGDNLEDDWTTRGAHGGYCNGSWNKPRPDRDNRARNSSSRSKSRSRLNEGTGWLERRNSKNKDTSKLTRSEAWRHTRRPRRTRDIQARDFF